MYEFIFSAVFLLLLAVFAYGAFRMSSGGSKRFRQVRDSSGRFVGLVDLELEEPNPRPPVDLDTYRLERKEGARLDAPRRRWVSR